MTTPVPQYEWRPVEHTADLAIAISSFTREGLFRAALDGLLGILEIRMIEPDKTELLEVHQEQDSGSIENNLVDFLNDCLYMMDIEETIPFRITSIKYEKSILEVEMVCRSVKKFDRSSIGKIKATTYSDLEVKLIDGMFQAVIIFDT